MNIKKYFLFPGLLGLFFINSVQAQESKKYTWQAGEELVYDVSWSFIDLGVITLKNLGKTEVKGYASNHIQVTIESNPLLFWLEHESVYNSYITDDLKVIRFVSDENIDGVSYNGQYDFNYDRQVMELTLFDKKDPKKITKKIIPILPGTYDGISLIQYARVNSLDLKQDTARTFIEDKSGDVVFNFLLTRHITEIEAIPDGVNTVFFNGEIKMKGIAGLTGPFETWYSDDYARVPVVAFMEVFIGRVRVELIKWKNWTPSKVISESKK